MARDERDEELISTGRERRRQKSAKKAKKAEQKTERKNALRAERKESKANKANIKKAPKKRAVKYEFAEEEDRRNHYFIGVAQRYRYARCASFIVLVAFVLVMLTFFRGNITYANLMYLIRDLDSDNTVTVGVYSDISYDEQYMLSFDTFKGRIATVSPTGFNLYSSTGSTELSDSISYGNPKMETGEKYAIVYDAGGKNYSLFTSVSKVFSGECEKVIEDGCVALDGYYALMTRSENSKYMITVYDDSFRAVNKYYKDKYVVDIALSPDGRELCTVAAVGEVSDFNTEVMCGKVGTEESTTVTLKNSMPIWTGYTENGTLLVLCDTTLACIDDGKIKWEHKFSGDIPDAFDLNKNLFALSVNKNAIGSENELFVFDTEGVVVYNNKISKRISHFATDGLDTVYSIGEGVAEKTVISTGDKTKCEIEEKVMDILCPPGNLIVCTSDKTRGYFTGDKK